MKFEKDYYQILGVSSKATSAEIRRVYHRLAILNHPDRNPSAQATLRMQEINEAYSVLGDKRKRLKYDSERGNSTAGSPTASSPQATTPTANLQQILAEEVAPRVGLLSILTISVFLAASIGFLVWSLLTLHWEYAMYAFFILVTGSASMVGIFYLWRWLKSVEIEARCPRCRNARAAEKISEKLTGVFQRRPIVWVGFRSQDSTEEFLISYERYKIHYRCKYCSYEWLFIKTRGQGII